MKVEEILYITIASQTNFIYTAISCRQLDLNIDNIILDMTLRNDSGAFSSCQPFELDESDSAIRQTFQCRRSCFVVS